MNDLGEHQSPYSEWNHNGLSLLIAVCQEHRLLEGRSPRRSHSGISQMCGMERDLTVSRRHSVSIIIILSRVVIAYS